MNQMLKQKFPILQHTLRGKRLVYLDSASTSQKPFSVIRAVSHYYEQYNANTRRGVYRIAEKSTQAYEEARARVAGFIGAQKAQVIFTKNATEGLNLAAYAWGEQHIKNGDIVAVTQMEHHSNFLPWQRLCRNKKAELRVIPIDDQGRLMLKDIKDARIKIACVSHLSNVLGTINDVARIKSMLPKHAVLVIDAAQSLGHIPVDVSAFGCDFLAGSSHKAYGPMGSGFLYCSARVLNEMEPFELGGGMIAQYFEKKNEWAEPPYKFEAGTQDVAGAVGFAEALAFIAKIGLSAIRVHEETLTGFLLEELLKDKDITVYGPIDGRGPVVSFCVKGIHGHDLAQVCSAYNVCIRAGHHCAMPLHEKLGVAATARASFGIYNTKEDVEILLKAIVRAKKIFYL
ncbi:MAG: Cysteine desulfurase [Parcubacteria group bacterium GW2011_GWA2_44_12]|nr:MAG: Cysteine desulfurase [Parcubacteria group bacterium GW2011_GWA2_44_12]